MYTYMYARLCVCVYDCVCDMPEYMCVCVCEHELA